MTASDVDVVVGVHLHDDAASLRRSLPTAIHQRLTCHLRVVVVADGSGHEAGLALAELVDRYPQVEVIHNAVRRGRAAARNQVLDVAGDAVVAWLDPGDVWHPQKLAIQHAVLTATGSADGVLACCVHRRVDLASRTEVVVEPDVADDPYRRLLLRESSIPAGTLMGTVATHRRAGGFDTGLAYRDDEDLLLRFLEQGGSLIVAGDRPLVTGSTVQDHPTGREVAAAARRLRRRHGRTTRVADPRSVRRAHLRELRRAERLYREEGRPVLAAAQRLRATAGSLRDRGHGDSRTGHARAEPPPEPTEVTAEVQRPSIESPRPAYARVHQAVGAEDWATAIAAWDDLSEDDRGTADPSTVEVVARALRAAGHHARAIEAAHRGLARWPEHPRIEMELAKSRAATTDWAAAFRPAPEVPATPTGPGVVSSLGALAGGEGPVTGHLSVAPSPVPTRVTLRAGDLAVVSTYARAPRDSTASDEHEFALRCEQLLEFLGDGDRITVVVDGRPLPIDGLGSAAEVVVGYPSRLEALRRRLQKGAVFTKFGRLRPGNTPARKRRVMDLVADVTAAVESAVDVACTPFYGNLLGAVREQDFIAHDVGGFDIGYLSTERTPSAVRAEFLAVCRALIDRGFHLELEPFSALVRRAPGDRTFVDLNYAWLTDDGELQLSYGWRDRPVRGREGFDAPRDTFLAGRLVPVPGDAEGVLHQVYGSSWAVPDQGSEVDHELRRAEDFLLTGSERQHLLEEAPDRVRLL